MLAHALVAATESDGGAPARWMYFLHGILGTGNNLRTIAKSFVARRPQWGAVLVDLRLHGQSRDVTPPDDLASCARDLVELEAAIPGPVRGVFGHSFGGKVALEYLRVQPAIELAFIVDSTPGARPDARGSEATVSIVRLLESLPKRLDTRDEFVSLIMAAGHSRDIAMWLALNVRPLKEGGYSFVLDVPRIAAMLDRYFMTDAWDVVESGRARIEMIVGGRSTVLDSGDRARAMRIAAESRGRVAVHVIPDAGHWVHVDAPAELVDLVVGATPP